MIVYPDRRTLNVSAGVAVLFLAFTSILYAQSGEPAIDLSSLSLGALAVKTLVVLAGLVSLAGSVYLGAMCLQLISAHRERFGFPALTQAAEVARTGAAAMREASAALRETGIRASRYVMRQRPVHNNSRS